VAWVIVVNRRPCHTSRVSDLILSELLANEPNLVVAGTGSDGAEAIALADNLRPDVVVMDLRMPGMNGAEAAAAILRPPPDHPNHRPDRRAVRAPGSASARRGDHSLRAQIGPYTALLEAVRAA
jgi:CheY-like chemotaxis protein